MESTQWLFRVFFLSFFIRHALNEAKIVWNLNDIYNNRIINQTQVLNICLYYNALLLFTSAGCSLNLTREKLGYERLAERNVMKIWELGQESDTEYFWCLEMLRGITANILYKAE